MLFEKISSSHSGITFNNSIIENDSINPLDVVNIYNGGGVGIGDFNNDGVTGYFFYRQYGALQICILIKAILNLKISQKKQV